MMEVPYHYQFRIIVIGDTMVGKSSLLKTFSEGTFGEMEPTVGVDFFSKIIDIQPKHHKNSAQNSHLQSNSTAAYNNNNTNTNRLDENIIVKLQIWDTAGQERFKSIVTSYYRNSVGIVLVYDVTNRESFEHLIDWFEEARKHVEPSPSPPLSPISQNPSSINNSYNSYPLTSTPNPSQLSKKSTNNNPNHLNSNSHSNHRSGNNNSSSSFSNSNNNRNNTNNLDNSANLSFKSLNETSRFRQPQEQTENFKMAYLVLGCKTDLENQRQVSYEDGQAFADAYGFKFIETSSKMHFNVNQAFQLLAEEIYDKISECGRLNRLHRTASGDHLTFDGAPSQINEGIRLGPLIENGRRYGDINRVRLLEAQPVSGYLGGCC